VKIGVRKAKDGGETAMQADCVEILDRARRHGASGEPFSVVLRVRAGLSPPAWCPLTSSVSR